MNQIYAVRHGETDWNRAGRFQGQIDIPLNAAGQHQAVRLARRLADTPFKAIYCSDLARARETVAPLATLHGLKVEAEVRLRERSYGVFEGLTRAEIAQRHPVEYLRWLERDPDFVIPGGESMRGFSKRALAVVREIAARHARDSVLILTHGGVLDVIYREALGLPLGKARSWKIDNAALNQVRVEAGRIGIVAWADRAHLED